MCGHFLSHYMNFVCTHIYSKYNINQSSPDVWLKLLRDVPGVEARATTCHQGLEGRMDLVVSKHGASYLVLIHHTHQFTVEPEKGMLHTVHIKQNKNCSMKL